MRINVRKVELIDIPSREEENMIYDLNISLNICKSIIRDNEIQFYTLCIDDETNLCYIKIEMNYFANIVNYMKIWSFIIKDWSILIYPKVFYVK